MSDPVASAPRFIGRTALITGGVRGIGRAIADALAREGAHVHVTTRSKASATDFARGGELSVLTADPSSVEDMSRAVAAASAGSGLDICVANAGMPSVEVFLEAPSSCWEELLRANVHGVLVTLQAAARDMRASGRGGRLLVISSAAGLRAEAHAAVYGASKAALLALVEALAVELAPHNITVNAIAPGEIDTQALREGMSALEALEGWPQGVQLSEANQRIPLGRIGSPLDVGGLAAFLMSDEASYITGTTVRIDGGYLLAVRQRALD
jgi:NAD(P)-dependent dehydrogenase (short-subunit alcohol dehydrogenase family)